MKQKKVVITAILLVLTFLLFVWSYKFGGISFLGNGREAAYVKAIKTGHEGELLPDIDLLLADSITYRNVGVTPLGIPTVLFYFGPDCPYCQAEVQEIIKEMKSLKNIQFYLITPYSPTELRAFENKYRLDQYSNLVAGVDYKYKFGVYFKTQIIPYLAIYDRERRLIAGFQGVLGHDQIKSVIEN